MNTIALGLLEQTVVDAGRGFLESMAESVAEAAGNTVKEMTAWWMGAGNSIGGNTPAQHAATTIQSGTRWLVAFVAVIGVLTAAARMIWQRDGKPALDVLRSLILMVVTSGAGLTAVVMLTEWADQFAAWVMRSAPAAEMFRDPAAASIGPIVLLCLAGFMLLVSLLQWMLMLSRDALLVIFAGFLPLAAAATGTGYGQRVFARYTTWLFALIIYKPVAAAIYWTAFTLAGTGDSLPGILSGLTLLVLAIIALPALMRLVAPGVEAVMGRGGGAMAAGAAVASGAVMVLSTGGTAAPAAAASATGALANAAGGSVGDGRTQ